MNEELQHPPVLPEAKSSFTPPAKTPLYEAVQGDRYQRQDLIRTLQRGSAPQLLCYVGGTHTSIRRDDALGFVDLLSRVEPGSDVDLVLHSAGGDIDAAEKLISMVRSRVGNGTIRVVVPDFAKSAATLMALGGDVIVMSDSSELGPIDPQVPFPDGQGSWRYYSAFSYIEAFRRFRRELDANPGDATARIMLDKLDPHVVVELERVYERTRHLAEGLLKTGMLAGEPVTAVVSKLLDNDAWYTHGQVISAAAAERIGLHVTYVEPDDQFWQLIWKLYCLQRLEVGDNKKLFESDFVSLAIDAS